MWMYTSVPKQANCNIQRYTISPPVSMIIWINMSESVIFEFTSWPMTEIQTSASTVTCYHRIHMKREILNLSSVKYSNSYNLNFKVIYHLCYKCSKFSPVNNQHFCKKVLFSIDLGKFYLALSWKFLCKLCPSSVEAGHRYCYLSTSYWCWLYLYSLHPSSRSWSIFLLQQRHRCAQMEPGLISWGYYMRQPFKIASFK